MKGRHRTGWIWVASMALVLAACGGGDSDTTEASDEAPAATEATAEQDAPPNTEAPAATEAPAEDEPAEEPAAAGEPLIVLTIGDETWEFPGAQCAFYFAPAGEEGSEWNVSNVNNGLQVYVNSDSFGEDVSIADIENGGNPTVSWEAFGDAVSIEVDGNDISATGTFTDNVNGGTAEGTLTATCPSWFDAT